MKYDEKDPAKRILALEARIQRQRSEIKSLMIRVLDAEPKARHFSARWLEQGDEIVVLRKCITTLEAALAEALEDSKRMDYLEGEMAYEQRCIAHGQSIPSSLFRRNVPITRAAIDAARKERS